MIVHSELFFFPKIMRMDISKRGVSVVLLSGEILYIFFAFFYIKAFDYLLPIYDCTQ